MLESVLPFEFLCCSLIMKPKLQILGTNRGDVPSLSGPIMGHVVQRDSLLECRPGRSAEVACTSSVRSAVSVVPCPRCVLYTVLVFRSSLMHEAQKHKGPT